MPVDVAPCRYYFDDDEILNPTPSNPTPSLPSQQEVDEQIVQETDLQVDAVSEEHEPSGELEASIEVSEQLLSPQGPRAWPDQSASASASHPSLLQLLRSPCEVGATEKLPADCGALEELTKAKSLICEFRYCLMHDVDTQVYVAFDGALDLYISKQPKERGHCYNKYARRKDPVTANQYSPGRKIPGEHIAVKVVTV
jgi:hypothetical protein